MGEIVKIFVSYARADKPGAERVVERLTQIDHEPWVDKHLTGGQQWWDEILRVIRDVDVFVIILSPASLASQACQLERQYAERLGKFRLPVKIAPVSTSALPPDLSSLQIVDFTGSDFNHEAATLIRALNRRPPPRPLPVPMPPLPPAPLSYLSNLHERINAHRGLTYADQLAIVDQLDSALRSADVDEREGGVALLSRLSQRRDLFAGTARQIERMHIEQSGSPAPGYRGESPHASQHRPSSDRPTPGQHSAGNWGVPKAPPPSGSSKAVKILAWIGAIVIALFILGVIAQSGSSY